MAQQKQPSKKAAAEKVVAAGKSRAKGSASGTQQEQGTTPEERYRMIAEAAYRIAELRGFQGDMALNDWLQAEAAVDARVAAKH